MQMKMPSVEDAQRGSFAWQSAQEQFSGRDIAACTRFFGSPDMDYLTPLKKLGFVRDPGRASLEI
jgi:hypothetical protein